MTNITTNADSVVIRDIAPVAVKHRPLLAQKGFTLLEILISFALMSIMLAMMYSGLRMVYRTSDNGESQINASSQVRTTQLFLRRQLTQILPIAFDRDMAQNPIVFRGESQKMTFVAPMPARVLAGGIYKQTVEWVSADGKSALVFRFEPVNVPDSTAADNPEPVMLLTAKAARFYYWDGEDTENKVWLEEWEDVEQIPSLIRLQLEFAEESKTVWPSLIIAPIRSRGTQKP